MLHILIYCFSVQQNCTESLQVHTHFVQDEFSLMLDTLHCENELCTVCVRVLIYRSTAPISRTSLQLEFL